MNRVNDKGMQIIEYKTELLKDYAPIVKNSMLIAVEQLAINGIIDADTHLALKDSDVTLESFIAAVHDKIQFMKTDEELLKEFEIIRVKVDEELAKYDLLGELTTKSIVSKDKIVATKIFCIDKQFVMDYFGVNEDDASKIMKRRQMVDKFTALRLAKIFKEFLCMEECILQSITLDATAPYFDTSDEEDGTYNINLVYEMNIEEVEQDDIMLAMVQEITGVNERVKKFYNEKMKC